MRLLLRGDWKGPKCWHSSISGSSAIVVSAGSWADIRLIACFCFFVLLQGKVIGGLDGLLHNIAVVGDQRMGRAESFPGLIGNSNLSDALIV